MIYHNGKQVGFIYKGNKLIERIYKDGKLYYEKGFLRELIGTSPLTIRGVALPLKNYEVFGNTTQESTTGKNLLNILSPDIISSGITKTILNSNEIKFNVKNSNRYARVEYMLNLKEGRTVLNLDVNTNNNIVKVVFLKGTTQLGKVLEINTNTYTEQTLTATFSSNIPDRLTIYLNPDAIASPNFDILIKNPIVTQDADITYEPYTGAQPSPNPDYPQEIESVGDKTKNLCPTNENDWEQGTLTNGLNNTSTTRLRTKDYIKIDTLNCYGSISGTDICFLNVWYYDEDKNVIKDQAGQRSINGSVSTKLDIPTNTKYIRIVVRKQNSSDIIPKYITNGKIQIEEGTTATPYEPYGYKIPVNVRNENLFGFGKSAIDTTTVYRPNATQRLIISKGINENEIKCNFNNGNYSQGFLEIKGIDGTLNYKISYTVSENTTNYNVRMIKDSSRSDNTKLVLFIAGENGATVVSSDNYFILSNIQIIEGTQPKPYQPYFNNTYPVYLDQPLRKIGNYVDYIDWKEQKVVRNIGEVILNGSETSWTLNQYGFYQVIVPNTTSEVIKRNGFSSHFKYEYNTKIDNTFFAVDNQIRIRYNKITDIDTFKSWLSQNNVKADYILKIPTEEAIELSQIPTTKGNNIITIDTKVKPSNVWIKYKSNK